ncbi:amidohydrolase family protein [bacterium]|nr:amidohydrolase family protein [bacterium]
MAGKTGTMIIRNGDVLLPDGTIETCDVSIHDGKIGFERAASHHETEIDAAGNYVLPGLIDLHTHGIGTVSTDKGTLEEYAHLEASRGTTTFYPTLFGPPEVNAANFRRYFSETDDLRKTPQILGFRLESPYLAQTGAGVSKDLAPISSKITGMLREAGRGFIKLWDVSPELDGAPGCIRELSEDGIIVSIAHTLATIEQARIAVDSGARLVTHLFDTFELPDITDPDPGVYPAGLVDYLLVEDRVTCEIIGDGTHVHPLLVEKTFRCKTPGRLVFVTDSNYGAGLPPGRYTLPGSWGNVEIDGCNNGVRMLDRNMELAGSALTPLDSFRNALKLFGKDIATASRVCSKTPAELMGLNKGEIAEGRDGDIIILDRQLELRYTIVGGVVVYKNERS